jgi:hypothetical protein
MQVVVTPGPIVGSVVIDGILPERGLLAAVPAIEIDSQPEAMKRRAQAGRIAGRLAKLFEDRMPDVVSRPVDAMLPAGASA